jgi:uncharacterized protein
LSETDAPGSGLAAAGRPVPLRELAAPVSRGERIELLDVVRGFALFGVLLGNLLWTGPGASLSDAQLAALPTAAVDPWADALWDFVGHDKANTLFAFLFGLGFAVQLERGAASGSRGGSFLGRYVRRLGVLFLFGLAHNFLLWYGDILHLYAVTGLLLIPLRRLSDRALVVGGLALAFLARPAFWICTHAVPAVAAYLDAQPDFYSDAARQARGEMLLSGSYADVLRVNLDVTLNDWILPFGFVPWIGYVLGRFLLGHWVGRNRFLEDPGRFESGWRRLLGFALPLGLAGSAWRAIADFLELELAGPARIVSGLFVQAGIVALAASYLAGIALLHLRSGRWRARLRRLAPVGRMALTNYLVQSFLYVFALYGVGLGLLDELGSTALWGIAVAFFALQMLASRWWLDRFEFGPCEWLWRALTYGRRPPFRRAEPPAAPAS